MSTVYTVPRPILDQPELTGVDCYLRLDTGQMGFARDTGLWSALVTGAWVFDRKTATLVQGDAAVLSTVRRNMRPFSVALFPLNQASVGGIQAAAGRRTQSRVAGTMARLKGAATPPGEGDADAFGASTPDLSAIARELPADCEAQIWAFSDRGEFCTVLTASPFRESRTASVLTLHGIGMTEVSDMSAVPAW